MALRFPDHDDVVFEGAPLTEVLCHIRFPPILALLQLPGVIGFQEALRREYPTFEGDQPVALSLTEETAEVRTHAPTWRMRDSGDTWQVSLGVEFVALETSAYTQFEEFSARLMEILVALERTLNPQHSTRVGIRKVNLLRHPQVSHPADWSGLVLDEQLGLLCHADLGNHAPRGFSELHLDDSENGTLTVRCGIPPDEPSACALDLDYWTETRLPIVDNGEIESLVRNYSNAITGYFHWCLTDRMRDYLRPRPRSEVPA